MYYLFGVKKEHNPLMPVILVAEFDNLDDLREYAESCITSQQYGCCEFTDGSGMEACKDWCWSDRNLVKEQQERLSKINFEFK